MNMAKKAGAARQAFYAVARGHRPGIYATWDECQRQVNGYPAAKFKKFDTVTEAEQFAGLKSYLPPIQTSSGRSQLQQAVAGPSGSRVSAFADAAAGSSSSGGGPKGKKRMNNLRGTALLPVREGEDGFMRTLEGRLVVYTDGGCTGNGRSNAKAGLGVYWGARSGKNLSEPVPGAMQTNNRGELLAILRALETAPEPKGPLEIRTDSRYCIDSMTTWLPGWRRNNFKSSSGGDVVNLDLVLHIERLLIARAFGAPSMDQITTRDVTQEPEIGDVNFVWVKGHVGEDGNTMADRLASAGCAFPTPRETAVYGQEEILYLYGLRSAAKKKAKPPAKGAAEPTTSGYFKPPPVRETATTAAMTTPSSSNAFARPNATASSSTASSSTPVASSSRPTVPAKRKQTEQRDAEVDELSDGGSDIVFVGSKKRPRQVDDDREFDELDASWILTVGPQKAYTGP